MFQSVQFLFNTFQLNLGKFSLPVTYWQAGTIIFLLFLLILALSLFRKEYVGWSMKGVVIGVFFGFFLALILEGFLLISGRTVLTTVLGWQNPPAPIARTLDMGKSKLIQVLGVQTQASSSSTQVNVTAQNALQLVQSLAPGDIKNVKNILCAP